MQAQTILITGCYGFLGFNTAMRLLQDGHKVVGIDRVQGARSPKAGRVELLSKCAGFTFEEVDIADYDALAKVFSRHKIAAVMHYAAQYAVIHKPEHVRSYAANNCTAFLNLIELSRLNGLRRFQYASSTFVEDGALPASLYGATKHFNELAAHVYSAAHGMTTVGIRYGSTFGPWCRPDVGVYQLAKKLLNRKPIQVRGGFHYQTAFLDVDDAVAVTAALLFADLKGYHVYTAVAEDDRRDLGEILRLLEKHLGKAICDWRAYKKPAAGGIPQAQCDKLRAAIGFAPSTKIPDAVAKFCTWAKTQHKAGKL